MKLEILVINHGCSLIGRPEGSSSSTGTEKRVIGFLLLFHILNKLFGLVRKNRTISEGQYLTCDVTEHLKPEVKLNKKTKT